jgi:hypothetical protein
MSRENLFGSFQTTNWTGISRAKAVDPQIKRQALAELATRYRPALLRYLVAVRKMKLDRAEDLVQDFLAVKILQRDLVAKAEKSRGKFRSFLLKSLNNYVIDCARAAPDPELSIDEERDDRPSQGDGEGQFAVEWARQTMGETYRRMEAYCQAEGKMHVWRIFDERVIQPTLHHREPPAYEELAKKYGFRSPKEASLVFVTGKRMFDRMLRSVIGDYARNDEEIAAEIADLMELLSKSRM